MEVLERLFETEGSSIQAALDFDIVDETLLYSALLQRGQSYVKHRLLARYGIELSGSKAYYRLLHRSPPPFYLMPDLDVFEDVVQVGLLKWKDLWTHMIHFENLDFLDCLDLVALICSIECFSVKTVIT